MIGDYRAPDRLRLGPAPITTRFTDVWDALDTLRTIIETKAYADIPRPRPPERELAQPQLAGDHTQPDAASPDVARHRPVRHRARW